MGGVTPPAELMEGQVRGKMSVCNDGPQVADANLDAASSGSVANRYLVHCLQLRQRLESLFHVENESAKRSVEQQRSSEVEVWSQAVSRVWSWLLDRTANGNLDASTPCSFEDILQLGAASCVIDLCVARQPPSAFAAASPTEPPPTSQSTPEKRHDACEPHGSGCEGPAWFPPDPEGACGACSCAGERTPDHAISKRERDSEEREPPGAPLKAVRHDWTPRTQCSDDHSRPAVARKLAFDTPDSGSPDGSVTLASAGDRLLNSPPTGSPVALSPPALGARAGGNDEPRQPSADDPQPSLLDGEPRRVEHEASKLQTSLQQFALHGGQGQT